MRSPARAFHPRNTLTYAGLLLGCGAGSAALLGHIGAAAALVALAVIADTFDGRFARLFSTRGLEPAIGVELDSLCDACTFGMAPVISSAVLGVHAHSGVLIWVARFFYLMAALTRLAFYNPPPCRVRRPTCTGGALIGRRRWLHVNPTPWRWRSFPQEPR